MKTVRTSLFILAMFFFVKTGFSQVNIVSANGYTVNVVIQPRAIVTSSSSCTWGYNYNLRLDYSVTFTGSNRPGSLYTLQGNFGCGAATHFFSLPLSGGNGTVITQSNAWRSVSDCATATISSLQCNTVQLIAAGPGLSGNPVSFSISTNPLPVKLTAFDVTANGQEVEVKWETAAESDNDFFTVERSADGTTWTIVKIQPGMGNASTAAVYKVTDTDPLAGLSYYRLKQTDIDGKSSYSETRQVKIEKKYGISIYPVPNNGRTLYFRGVNDPRYVKISIRNSAGTLLFNDFLRSTALELPRLSPGLYFITIHNEATGLRQQEKYIQL